MDWPENKGRGASVAMLVEKYFEWVGAAKSPESVALPPSGTFDVSCARPPGRYKIVLNNRRSGEDVVWEWTEVRRLRRSGERIQTDVIHLATGDVAS